MKKVVYICCACGNEERPENEQVPPAWLVVRLDVGRTDRTIIESGPEGQHACSTKCAASILTKAAETVVSDVASVLSTNTDVVTTSVTEH